MKIRIKVAETATELDQLFRLRHDVFCREQRYMAEQHDGRLVDRFDAFPGIANIVALVDGAVVGGVRVVEAGPLGFPAQDYFDFSSHIPPGARLASGSMFAVLPRYRRDRLPLAITGMSYTWVARRGLTHVAAAVSPLSEQGFLASGFRACAPRYLHAASGLAVRPMLLAMEDLEPRLAAFVEAQQVEPLLDVFERELLKTGDIILAEGEVADAVRVIIEGRVGLVAGGELRAELGPGAPLGESSLLLGEPSAHAAVALGDVLLMVVPRAAFIARVQANGEAAVHSMRLLARQLVQARGGRAQSPAPASPEAAWVAPRVGRAREPQLPAALVESSAGGAE